MTTSADRSPIARCQGRRRVLRDDFHGQIQASRRNRSAIMPEGAPRRLRAPDPGVASHGSRLMTVPVTRLMGCPARNWALSSSH
jgi:hypothetical protein